MSRIAATSVGEAPSDPPTTTLAGFSVVQTPASTRPTVCPASVSTRRTGVSPAASSFSSPGRSRSAAYTGCWRLLQPVYAADLDLAGLLKLDAAGETPVRRVLTDAGHTVGRVLAGVCTTLNPAKVVVGGSLGASPTLVAAIRDGVDRYAHPEAAATCEVVSGKFGGRAELIGSLALAISRAVEVA